MKKIFEFFGYYKINKSLSDNGFNKQNLLDIFYKNIISTGFKPEFIVDIGANTGTWTRDFTNYFPNTKVLMIEPQENLVKYFKDILNEKISCLTLGVGNKNEVLTFTIHERDDSCSFIYTEEEAKERGFKQIKVPVKTLNTIISENNLPCPDIIKIDAEGLDLEVIEGSSDFYGKTEIFLVEASVCNKKYQNTIAKIISKMDECGYQLFEITDLNRPFPDKPILWLVELAFVKKDGYILKNLNVSI